MRNSFPKTVLLSAALISTVVLGSCNSVEENFLPDFYTEVSPVTIEIDETNETAEAFGLSEPTSSSAVSRRAETAAHTPTPKIATRSEISDGRLSFIVENVYSQGEYYTVSVIGEKTADGLQSTYINGEPYGNFRLTLAKDGAELDSLAITVTDGDRFLIMESILCDLTYGCTVISNKRELSADDYPDIIQLDLYNSSELEIPQYGRYFAVFDGRLTELPVYENGIETAPRGTHLELRGEGRMVQHLCVYTPSGKSLMVEKYEYIFDTGLQRLNKRKVDFLGWNVDN